MKISILTPSYNSGKYIDRAIQSVLNQNYANWEHIIIDGGSTDNTLEILGSYEHLKWISEPDQGQSDAMNKAFEISDGDIIVYLNADDFFNSGVFSAVINRFNKSNADFIVGQLKIQWLDDIMLRQPTNSHFDVIRYWKHKCPANPVAYFYKRRIQKSIGSFPVSNHYTMDYWFLIRAYEKSKIDMLDFEFGVFWVDGKNKTYISNIGENLHSVYCEYFNSKGKFGKLVGEYLFKSRKKNLWVKDKLDRLICKTII